MKKNNIHIFIFGVLAAFLLSACDFEEINTNSLEMTDEQGTWDDFAVGGTFLTMQRAVATVGTQADGTDVVNQYQISYNLSADVWSGYFGQNNNWNSGNNHTTNYLVDGWISSSYRNSYANVLPSWKRIKENAKEIPEYYALAQILKISSWHKTSDMFGPIPYKNAGEPVLVVPYDSQEDVYKYFLSDLEEAINVLTVKSEEGALIIPDYDAMYGGNTTKWVKYANSLMLRLAMRIRFADPVTAQKYAEMAVNHPVGVMTVKEDEAKMGVGAGLNFVNNIETLASQYNECRMGSSIYSYLMGYQDPRLGAYFKPSNSYFATEAFDGEKYQAVPTGHTDAPNNTYKALSIPNIEKSTPTYILRASEVYFLRAEGALIGWNMGGEAASLYEQGIALSFEENGVNTNLLSGYIRSGNKPVKYELNAFLYRYSAAAPTEATVEFTGTSEEKLEKIITQKWIALYPNGQEAWSEWRRTGYPKLHRVNSDRGNLGALGVRRMNYPVSSYQSGDDRQNIQEAIKMLGGDDSPSTRLWWDAK